MEKLTDILFKSVLSPNSTTRKWSRRVLIFFLIPIFIIFSIICEHIFPEWCVEILNCIFTIIVLDIIVISLIFPLIKKITKITKLSKEDFLKNEDYYRDLILNYDLIELSYIDNLELNKDKDVVVALINMELKGIISLQGPRVKIVNKSGKLKKSEKYILNLIKRNAMYELDIENLKEETIKDCLEDKLIYETNRKKLIIYLCITFVFNIVFFFLSYRYAYCIFIFLLSIFLFSIILAMIINPYKRTKNGQKINKQLEGLKLFLKDFSLLHEKEYSEVLLWKDYLAYSVLFNQNDKVVKEILNKIN